MNEQNSSNKYKCPNCGAQIKNGKSTCEYCGSQVSNDDGLFSNLFPSDLTDKVKSIFGGNNDDKDDSTVVNKIIKKHTLTKTVAIIISITISVLALIFVILPIIFMFTKG